MVIILSIAKEVHREGNEMANEWRREGEGERWKQKGDPIHTTSELADRWKLFVCV